MFEADASNMPKMTKLTLLNQFPLFLKSLWKINVRISIAKNVASLISKPVFWNLQSSRRPGDLRYHTNVAFFNSYLCWSQENYNMYCKTSSGGNLSKQQKNTKEKRARKILKYDKSYIYSFPELSFDFSSTLSLAP